MTRTLEFHPEAGAEVDEGVVYYNAITSELAEDFLASLEAAIAYAQDLPEAFTAYLHGTRCVRLTGFPFRLVYRVDPKRILIVALAHTSRRPGYWAIRL